MRIDHDDVPPEPPVPDGVLVRTGPGDDGFRREGHAVLNAAFAGQFGFAALPFDEWHERIEASATHDWSQLRVAYVDGEPVAMLYGNNAFIEDEGCGYVSNVGVLPTARGRGWPGCCCARRSPKTRDGDKRARCCTLIPTM